MAASVESRRSSARRIRPTSVESPADSPPDWAKVAVAAYVLNNPAAKILTRWVIIA
jgi:hypothetical protein